MKFIQITGHVRLFCTFYFSNKIVFTWRYLSFNEQVTFWTSINRVSVERVRPSLGVKVFVSAQQTPVEELQLSCEKNWCTWFSFAAQITFISWKTIISEICHYLWRYDVCGCAWISYDLQEHLIFLVRARAIDVCHKTFCCVVLLCIFKEFYRTSKITLRYYPPKRSFRTEKRKTEEAICDRSCEALSFDWLMKHEPVKQGFKRFKGELHLRPFRKRNRAWTLLKAFSKQEIFKMQIHKLTRPLRDR